LQLDDPRHIEAERPTIRAHVATATERLRMAGLSSRDAAFDAELLARTVLEWDRAAMLTRAHEQPPTDFSARYDALIARREQHEPAAQVLGHREFWGREFEVTRDVLVPRPETELIVETAVRLFQDGAAPPRPFRVVDVGTGSGCLAVSLALEWPLAEIVATDVSEAALRVASRNAAHHGVENRIRFVRTSVLKGLTPGFDLIVTNPPYVRSGDRPALSPEVRDYEPAEALFGGADGLDVIRTLLDEAPAALASNGRVLMEFGAGQDEAIVRLVHDRPPLRLEDIRPDLCGIPRMAVISRRE
jgi:release factor glutamine methyltransferase